MPAFWNTGTITLTTGSTTVTGQGTDFLNSTGRPGDTIESDDGRRATVLSINSPTSITLDKPWRGNGQTAAPYKLWFTPDDVTLEGLGRRALSALSSGNVNALADLVLGSNKGIHGTGDGTLATHDLTPLGRDLLGKTNAAGMLQTLGLQGLGSLAPTATNANECPPGTVRFMSAGTQAEANAQNLPGVGSWYILTMDRVVGGGLRESQIAVQGVVGTPQIAARARASSGFQPWFIAYTNGNLLRPNNAEIDGGLATIIRAWDVASVRRAARKIITRGSNSNGQFAIYDDGWQECFHYMASTVAWDVSESGFFRPADNMEWYYPANFNDGNGNNRPIELQATTTVNANVFTGVGGIASNLTNNRATFRPYAASSQVAATQKGIFLKATGWAG